MSSRLNIIIFSKNRPCQLDALLRSIQKHIKIPFSISVLCKVEAPFVEGYRILSQRPQGKSVNWCYENDFSSQTKKLVAQCDPGSFVMFLVDDIIFKKSLRNDKTFKQFGCDKGVATLSLRLGKDITADAKKAGKKIPGTRWDPKAVGIKGWNYPMSVDGNIFRAKDLQGYVHGLTFHNPNSFESAMSVNPLKGDMMCYPSSRLVNLAINKVQTEVLKNACGDIDQWFLNEQWRKGFQIKLEPIEKLKHTERHVIIDSLAFEKQFGEPPEHVPLELLDRYTVKGTIRVIDNYRYGVSSKPQVFRTEQVEEYIKLVQARQGNYYKRADSRLYEALSTYSIKGKSVGVVGSMKPWYETVCLCYGAVPITVEYNTIVNEANRWKVMTVDEYRKNPVEFDAVISISSLEHDGLGRYGDPLNPEGDLDAMHDLKSMVVKNGLLFLSVPVGLDTLVWNSHRVYGAIRLPMLMKGWKVLAYYGYCKRDLKKDCGRKANHQPVFVLQNI